MPLSKGKALEIFDFFNKNGKEKTLSNFNGIKESTLERYIRMAKQFGQGDTEYYDKVKIPKILLFDIETAPMQVFSWTLFKPMLSPDNIIRDWHVISWAAKWIFEPEIKSQVLTRREIMKQDDKRIVNGIWELFNQADVVIAHNGNRFDIKKLNTRFILHGLTPPSHYQSIDTLRVVKDMAAFSSNKLDYLGMLVRNKGKIQTDFHLWVSCVSGDEEALSRMEEYNKEDVNLLEEVYLMLRPWIRSHPNIAIYSEATKKCCPNCGSFDLEENGVYTTMAGQYQAYKCNSCGAPSRTAMNMISHADRKNLLRSNAR